MRKKFSTLNRGAFCPFPFRWIYYTAIVVNPPEKKLAKRTSVHCTTPSRNETGDRKCNFNRKQPSLSRFCQDNSPVYVILWGWSGKSDIYINSNHLHQLSQAIPRFPSVTTCWWHMRIQFPVSVEEESTWASHLTKVQFKNIKIYWEYLPISNS